MMRCAMFVVPLLLLLSCRVTRDLDAIGTLTTTLPTLWDTGDGVPIMFPDGGAWEGDNIYAPDVHYFDRMYHMWYGGQGRDGHDRIHYAKSTDGRRWTRHPDNPVLDCGSSNHVNDPSVVRVGDTFSMYYTDAATGEDDRIHLAISNDGVKWRKVGLVLDTGSAGSWESFKVGRPSVLYEDGSFKMWYDGSDGSSRDVGYATSSDGRDWNKHRANPVFRNAGAVDVKRVGDTYVMVRESRRGTLWAVASNETDWADRGYLFNLSGSEHDRYGQVTPMVFVRDGRWAATYYGGASAAGWNHNRIMAAVPRER
jgi:predicted GH43/DUF377 family glycosyl hydrolase